MVAKWRQLLITIHAEKDRMETEKQEADAEVQKLATALFNDVRNIRNTGIGDDLERITAAIKDERSALRDLGENLSELKSSASVRPMTCYQAYQTVAYNFRQAMGYTYNQTLGYANSQYRSAMGTLELRLSHVDAIVGGIRESASKLKDEIRVSKFTPPALDIAPGMNLVL